MFSVRISAAISPMTTPSAAVPSAARTTEPMTVRCSAPSAMRRPISAVFCETL
jgi:hypothetical protein